MRRSQVGRADLLRMINAGYDNFEDLEDFAVNVGMKAIPLEPSLEKQQVQATTKPEPKPMQHPVSDSAGWPDNAKDAFFWRCSYFESKRSERTRQIEAERTKSVAVEWKHAPSEPPEYQPLAPWRVLEPRLRSALQEETSGRKIDIRKVVKRLARGRVLTSIPRLPAKLADRQLTIVSDRSNRLVPYWFDQDLVFDMLSSRLPPTGIRDCVGTSPNRLVYVDGDPPQSFSNSAMPERILILGDLGALESSSTEQIQAWHSWLRRLASQRVKLLALVPCGTLCIPKSIRSVVTVVSWQTNRSAWIRNMEQRRKRINEILMLLAPVIRLEPGLLRDVRVMLSADASLESEIWQHHALQSQNSEGAKINEGYSRDQLDQYQASETAARAFERIKHWRCRFKDSPYVWFEEVARLKSKARERLLTAEEIDEAFAAIRSLYSTLGDGGDRDAYVKRLAARFPDYAKDDPKIGSLVVELCAFAEGSGGISDPMEISISQSSDAFVLGDNSPTSPIASVAMATPHISVQHGPDWATDWGVDEFGIWVEFQVDNTVEKQLAPNISGTVAKTVTQRMRWIPPGAFMMGSPEDEEERYADEGPQREVTLTRGFWMFDTPVTQQLWESVLGDNPSHFRGEKKPVERVSWDDAQRFIATINQQTGITFSLPTESQWEFACRAGTNTRYAFGDELTPQQAAFESDDGTEDVASYAPNPWGLYDMHGNVWEWCEDWWSNDFTNANKVDPRGSKEGVVRVIRGGSWGDVSRLVRSANRNGSASEFQGGSVGFRCAQVQDAAEPTGEWLSGGAQAVSATGGVAAELKIDPYQPQSIQVPDAPAIIIKTDVNTLRLDRITKPSWASAIGRDKYGLWAEFRLPVKNAAFMQLASESDESSTLQDAAPVEVKQRLRWIPPGRFLMGSPPVDEMAFEWERPQHEVTISHGYWLFDTPVTQSLWTAVMNENPTDFPGTNRPVENTTWLQCQQFLSNIGNRLPGLDLVLPTEAQWEYACRAGSTTRYAFGDVPSTEQGQFEADEPCAVASYEPNSWGLYDMHGNVWEWCHDFYDGHYSDASLTNPTGPRDGQNRVIRGGSWILHARFARSASRSYYAPDNRVNSVGLRCAQVHSSSRNAGKRGEGEGNAMPRRRS